MLLLLDRDGVINEDLPQGVIRPEELRLIKGAAKAIATANQAGWKVAVVSNQSAIGKGLLSEAGLAEIHQKLKAALAEEGAHLDAIFYCPDHADRPSHRRKPAPGMLEDALAHFNVAANQAVMVGDALRDLQAAAAMGIRRLLVETGKGAITRQRGWDKTLEPVSIYTDLAAAIHALLADPDNLQ